MSASTKLVDKMEGVEKFCAWKYRIGLVLEENDLEKFVKGEIQEPDNAAEKAKYQKDTIRTKRIIADSIKDHLIPYVSSKKTLKEMFDALTRLYEGKNINRKMNLRTQLKNTRMQKGETIQESTSKRRLIKSLNRQTNSIIKNLIQGDFRRKDNERKEITQLYNATIVIRWDTLQNYVQPDEKNRRENIRGTMPM
jgi:hypothetical protein